MLIIDVAANKSCDMSKHENISFFAALITQEVTIGIVCGPPCETWTSAREHHVQGSRTRPVRSCDKPWGSQSLTMRERRQIAIGNLLLRASLTYVAHIMRCKGFAILEHPTYPHWAGASAPSTWKHPHVNAVRRTIGIDFLSSINACLGKPVGHPLRSWQCGCRL